MKFLIRRIRFAIAGRVMRFLFTLFGFVMTIVLVLFLASGAVDQRTLVEKFAAFVFSSSKTLSEEVRKNGLPGELTDRGWYLPGKAPEGAKKINTKIDDIIKPKEDSNVENIQPDNSD